MLSTLRPFLALLAFTPLALLAQIAAGDPGEVIYTTVGEEIHPLPITFPGESADTISVDLEGDGELDLQFQSGRTLYVDAINNYNMVGMWHAGMEIAVSGPGGHVAKRLDAGALIDASLTWRAFDTGMFPNNSATLGNLGVSIGGPFITGGDEWLVSGPADTEGYLAVRIVAGAQVRYGWVGLVSHIENGSVRLQINDMGIQDASTAVADVPAGDRITARLSPDGNVLLQGPLAEVQRITVHDASGRMVRQLAAPVPATIDLSREAHGIYVLRLNDRSGGRSFKLAW